jgi:four helix bundle protein
MGSFKDLLAYKKSFELAMEIFQNSKSFPKEETYSLTDQIRRSSRSTNICITEAYRKRKYPNHFISKLTDADMENSETQGWLEFCKACSYITEEEFILLNLKAEEIGKLINYMIMNPEKFGSDTKSKSGTISAAN